MWPVGNLERHDGAVVGTSVLDDLIPQHGQAQRVIPGRLETLRQSGEDPVPGVMDPAHDAVVGLNGLQLGTVPQPEALVTQAYPE